MQLQRFHGFPYVFLLLSFSRWGFCKSTTKVLPMSETSEIRSAIEKGVAYLESVQLPSGGIPIDRWPNRELNGNCVPDLAVFPAALAARALSITSSAKRLHSRALDFLLREMEPDGLWCYPSSDGPDHGWVPLD